VAGCGAVKGIAPDPGALRPFTHWPMIIQLLD